MSQLIHPPPLSATADTRLLDEALGVLQDALEDGLPHKIHLGLVVFDLHTGQPLLHTQPTQVHAEQRGASRLQPSPGVSLRLCAATKQEHGRATCGTWTACLDRVQFVGRDGVYAQHVPGKLLRSQPPGRGGGGGAETIAARRRPRKLRTRTLLAR